MQHIIREKEKAPVYEGSKSGSVESAVLDQYETELKEWLLDPIAEVSNSEILAFCEKQ